MKSKNISIFIIGQCTLHWGRMEYGNIGNYYIIEPFFEQIRRVFPNATVSTTMQFSEMFSKKYNIRIVPMEIYYDFKRNDNLEIAKKELYAVEHDLELNSRFIDEVKKADLVIDFSGDIWGDNADLLGKDRFEVGCYKDLVSQKIRPTVMLAGSPGPFGTEAKMELAKKTYKGFRLVTNREPVSTEKLKEWGFDTSKTKDFPCPSFIFRPALENDISDVLENYSLNSPGDLKIGFILCGWNFEKGPFDRWPRYDDEYAIFVRVIKSVIKKYDANVYLMSHSNGFEVPPKKFELIHGRDYPIVEQLYKLLLKDGFEEKVKLLKGIYSPSETKAIIGKYDVLISGRMHGAVAGLSQGVPTVIIDYGHAPKAHKLKGFSEVAGVSDYIVDPNNETQMMQIVSKCIDNRSDIKNELFKRMEKINRQIYDQFNLLEDYC